MQVLLFHLYEENVMYQADFHGCFGTIRDVFKRF